MHVPSQWRLSGEAAGSTGGCADAAFVLDVLVLTHRKRLARDVERVCSERGHWFLRIERLADLQPALSQSPPGALLLDTGLTTAESARIAATVSAIYAGLPIVLVAAGPRARSEGGFRAVDHGRTGERYVDELELAHIGIPATYDGAVPKAWA